MINRQHIMAFRLQRWCLLPSMAAHIYVLHHCLNKLCHLQESLPAIAIIYLPAAFLELPAYLKVVLVLFLSGKVSVLYMILAIPELFLSQFLKNYGFWEWFLYQRIFCIKRKQFRNRIDSFKRFSAVSRTILFLRHYFIKSELIDCFKAFKTHKRICLSISVRTLSFTLCRKD